MPKKYDVPQRQVTMEGRGTLRLSSTLIETDPDTGLVSRANVRYGEGTENRAKVVVDGARLDEPWPDAPEVSTNVLEYMGERLMGARTKREVFEIVADLMATLPVT